MIIACERCKGAGHWIETDANGGGDATRVECQQCLGQGFVSDDWLPVEFAPEDIPEAAK